LIQLQEELPQCPPFMVELGEVAVFEGTRVIYLELRRGQAELERIHGILNSGSLYYKEPFQYHPHVTLAQGPTVLVDTDRKVQLARDRWEEFRLPKTFVVDMVMFVQNGGDQGWLDLNELSVGA
jgi:2'-5' RNA ligase